MALVVRVAGRKRAASNHHAQASLMMSDVVLPLLLRMIETAGGVNPMRRARPTNRV